MKPLYLLAFAGIALSYGFNNNRTDRMDWLVIPPALFLLWVVWRHLLLRFQTLTISGNKLRYEKGMLSRSTRTMELTRVQDVRVDQSLVQRMLGLGDISVETAGETGQLTMKGIERPQSIADYILEVSRRS